MRLRYTLLAAATAIFVLEPQVHFSVDAALYVRHNIKSVIRSTMEAVDLEF